MHVAVIGGGLGGLAAAAMLAEGGASVAVYERSESAGGRARSIRHGDRILNLGPHALYTGGAAMRVLTRLGVDAPGRTPPTGGLALRAGRLHTLPSAPLTLLTSTALRPGEKLAALKYLAARAAPDVTADEWLAEAPAGTADLMRASFRVSSYANAPDVQSARSAVAQLRLALRGVRYVHGGWQTLVERLTTNPRFELRLGHDVATLPDADAVVLAGPPALARSFGIALPSLVPARVACLDLALDPIPQSARFVLGLDTPLYLSDHGAVADLGGPVLHVARYLAPHEDGADVLPELEALLDLASPGWRAAVRFRRFLPALVATHRVDRVDEQVAGAHSVDGRPVHLVGDWVGEEGMLLDRALASAEAAADALLAARRMAA